MSKILKEIYAIMETNCDRCKVSPVVKREHGGFKQVEYCNKLCVVGKKLHSLSKEIQFGNEAKIGLDCTEENYKTLKKVGLTDVQIMKRFGISRNTLARRKKHWGLISKYIPEPKLAKKTKKEYLEMKLQNFSDKDIAKAWGVGKNTLFRWKAKNNLKGGLEYNYKLDEQGRTKEEYLQLKFEEKTDKEIARIWGVSKGTLLDWKKRNNLRGGL